ncbi:serine hydroxymethyltransferase [Actinocorallia sp. API 0066]|uniref:serine hydroxymethyltransferase n=1 Tax=Actinocorallia sp. API 0066 TaxID=2896846 RepID=UPI001E32AD60|nr:serine hydroxymethyltransferase [Actinocorallia sp. API 0066]MCD0447753.1 serine hydroxymethyltransferase [Actinocorallia sp. API 0066]
MSITEVGAAFTALAARELATEDPELTTLLDAELTAQRDTLAMVAYASLAAPSVLACGAAALANLTAEGYPGKRYHPGCARLDDVERLAVERAKTAFGARYANVQPHSCSSANLAVLFALLSPGDTLLGMDLDSGGHLTHGSPASVTGRHFRALAYRLGPDGLLDYDHVRDLAKRHEPKVIVAGASAYPRAFDYVVFREIADEVGAYLLADISHIAGLVAGGILPSPIDHAHITTTSTYKQLGGPRGGLILSGAEHLTAGPGGVPLARLLDRAVFPASQGTLNPAGVAAKARALDLVTRPSFRALAERIALDARALAAALARRGWEPLTGGTDTHMVIVDVAARGLTGGAAETALESAGILANRNRIAADSGVPGQTSGLRFGTNILAQRGLSPSDMDACADLADRVLGALRPPSSALPADVLRAVRRDVADLCARFPIPGYSG